MPGRETRIDDGAVLAVSAYPRRTYQVSSENVTGVRSSYPAFPPAAEYDEQFLQPHERSDELLAGRMHLRVRHQRCCRHEKPTSRYRLIARGAIATPA